MMCIKEIVDLAEKINDYWISINPDVGDCAWERGTYMIGNIAAYELTGKQEYLDYALNWAEKNEWRFYNDAENKTVSADSQACGQSYIRLMELTGRGTDENILKSMEYVLGDSRNDYWWWVDTIYMAHPLYNKMGIRYADNRYFDKVYRLFSNSCKERHCYNESEHLWYRDERFLPGAEKAPDGENIFWSRGNGWVFAGLARTLDILPQDNIYYSGYKKIFCDMAKKIKKCMTVSGCFTTDLLSAKLYPDGETSGTALFALGLFIGVRKGLLEDEYLTTAYQAVDWIVNESIDENGRIGNVQTVAWGPGPVKKENSSDYAVGTFLLVLSEMAEMLKNSAVKK